MQDDKGIWIPTPHYAITFSPNPYGEHATAFGGYGKNPPLKVVQKLAERAGFDDWQQAKIIIEKTIETIANFRTIAKNFGIRPSTIRLINNQLTANLKFHQQLLAS